MPTLFRYGLPLLLVTLLLAGCQALEVRERQTSLDKALRAYETAIRWSYIHQAYSLMRPEQIEEVEIPSGLENIKVTRYEVLDPAVNDIKTNTARQVAFISYVEKDRQQEKTLTDHQLWEYDDSVGRWYLISGVPAFIVEPKMRALPLDKK